MSSKLAFLVVSRVMSLLRVAALDSELVQVVDAVGQRAQRRALDLAPYVRSVPGSI
jgi:hypothetical protein